jgi:cation diffusion facilitator CzcD-associated flavoprotein CzcO
VAAQVKDSNRFAVLIIGAGQAGIPLVHDLAKAGKCVAVAERSKTQQISTGD